MPKAWKICTLVLGAVAAPLCAHAHHSFAIYDEQVTELTGRLTGVRWGNPHVQFELEADDGERWTLEGAAVYVLERRGITEDLFVVGQQIRVAGRGHRSQAPQLWLHNFQLGDANELLMVTGAEPRWSSEALGSDGTLEANDEIAPNRGIFRVWSRPQLRPIVYGDGLPYRIERGAGGLDWIERLDGFAERCEPVGMPGVMATPYPFEFVDHGAHIQLLGFSNNALIERTIHIAEPGTRTSALSRMGQSIGRWETATTLVVETKEIDWPYFDDSLGTPQSESMQTVETFTLNEAQNQLDYTMLVTDPATFTRDTIAIDIQWQALGETRAEPTFCSEPASL